MTVMVATPGPCGGWSSAGARAALRTPHRRPSSPSDRDRSPSRFGSTASLFFATRRIASCDSRLRLRTSLSSHASSRGEFPDLTASIIVLIAVSMVDDYTVSRSSDARGAPPGSRVRVNADDAILSRYRKAAHGQRNCSQAQRAHGRFLPQAKRRSRNAANALGGLEPRPRRDAPLRPPRPTTTREQSASSHPATKNPRPPSHELSVLDVGCGNLRFERFLAERSIPFRAVALDRCVELISKGREALEANDSPTTPIRERPSSRPSTCGRQASSARSSTETTRRLTSRSSPPGIRPHRRVRVHAPRSGSDARGGCAARFQGRSPGGHLALSFWQFLNSPRIAAKAHAATAHALDAGAVPPPARRGRLPARLATRNGRPALLPPLRRRGDYPHRRKPQVNAVESSRFFGRWESHDLNRYVIVRKEQGERPHDAGFPCENLGRASCKRQRRLGTAIAPSAQITSVTLRVHAANSSGVPANTISPPAVPPPGPMSIT